MNNTNSAPSRRDVKLTVAACYFGSFTQAAVANLPPLFYVLFNERLGMPLELIALFPTVFFGIQILIDALFSKIVFKIGYRLTAIFSDVISAVGLIVLGLSPFFSNPVATIFISGVLCAVGSGIIEITTSPLIEALPGDGKSSAMSFLHSFYCWGYLFVVLFTTGFFALFGKDYWFVLCFIFAVIPVSGGILYSLIGKLTTLEENGCSAKFSEFGKNALFLILFLLMICAGAGEQVVAQWASYFAEKGLNVSKTVGDLLGTSTFALCMALSRTFFGFICKKTGIRNALIVSVCALIVSYLVTALSPIPALSLIGIAACGISVGILWPATLSLAGESKLNGGTLMFALLALAGDIGCTVGPSVAGEISAATNINVGILSGVVFPVVALILLIVYGKVSARKLQNSRPLSE